MTNPTIRVIHRLPGRIRLNLDPMPQNTRRVEKELRAHSGIYTYRATPITRSILVCYDRKEIAEAEVVIRLALSLSLANDLQPVSIERSDEAGELDALAGASGLLLMGLSLVRNLPVMKQRRAFLDMIAVAGTAGSILAHAAEELKESGTFHPETLSVVYLMVSLAHGRGYSGSLLSWFTSFGRHFKGRFVDELIMQAEPQPGKLARSKRYSIKLQAGRRRLDSNSVLRFVPALIAHAIAGGTPEHGGMLAEVQEVSDRHGHMLEGLEGMKDGIAIHIRN